MTKNSEKTPRRRLASRSWHPRTVDLLRTRVNMLTGKDRVLMKMYLENGAGFRQISRLAGISEEVVARRIRSVTRRLAEGQYLNCLRHRSELSTMELHVAKDYFLRGLSMRGVAAKRQLTYYRVRETLGKIQRLLGESVQLTGKHQSNTKCEV